MLKTIHIVGAGGVASYLLPVLIKTFHPKRIIIHDKDILETRNLDRQLFKECDVGKNKAQALADMSRHQGVEINVVCEWFTEATAIDPDASLIICVADNHEARRTVMAHVDEIPGLYAIIGGNEYFDNEAYYYNSSMRGTHADPRVRHPEILTSHEGSPINCTGDAQISSPQLAIANMGCAHKILSLLWIHTHTRAEFAKALGYGEDSEKAIQSLPITIQQSLTITETLSHLDHNLIDFNHDVQ